MVTVKKGRKAVRLVKPYAKEADTETEEDGDKDEEEEEEEDEEEEEEDVYKEGEEEEEEEEMTDHSVRVPVVGDLPLDVQGFRRIHDQGPQGMTMPVRLLHNSYATLTNHLSASMYVCVYVCMYVCICACVYVCVYICTYWTEWIHQDELHMYICIYVYVRTYVCMRACWISCC